MGVGVNLLEYLVTVINLPVRKSTAEIRGKSAQSKCCHLICLAEYHLAVMGRNILGYLVTVTTSDSQEMCWQKWGSALNLLEDLVTVSKSASQESCWQILS